MKSSPYSPHYKNLRSWLKEQRLKRGYSQRDVSDLMNRHHSVVGKMEQDRRKIEILEFIRYCQVIGVDPHEGVEVLIQSISQEA
jgi:transcriptional regulator with XRE-family HTH domain